MANYAQVRTDLMSGTTNPADLVSVKYQVSGVDTPIENGNVVVVGGLVDGSTNVFVGSTPTAKSGLDSLILIASPEVIYDTGSYKTYADFRNEAGEIARGYRLRKGNCFSATMEAFGGRAKLADVVVGDVVELQAGTKLKIVAASTTDSTKVGEVIAKEDDMVVVRVG